LKARKALNKLKLTIITILQGMDNVSKFQKAIAQVGAISLN